ncbi:MAG: DNA recombination protein RmuC [Candidatus Melainabacteria bacterium]|nr:DNA recombination protein RmuC [Candidatus Melainabacteria bacterium]
MFNLDFSITAFVFGGLLTAGLMYGLFLKGARARQSQLEQELQQQQQQATQAQTAQQLLQQQMAVIKDEAQAQLNQREAQLEALRVELAERQQAYAATTRELDLLKTQQQQWKEQLETHWMTQFELISQKVLKTTREELTQQANQDYQQRQALTQSKIQEMIQPLKTLVEKNEQEMAQLGRQTLTETATLKEQLRQTFEATQALVGTNRQLKAALSNSKGRGDWGELELIRLLEESGLMQGIHYEFQQTQADAARPDVTVKLPNNRQLYIDAKSLLVHLENMELAESEELQAEARKKQLGSLRTEIAKLGKRAYQSKTLESLDFVILYVPRESMLRVPLEEDPGLMEEAFRQGVVLASPLILLAMLKTVAQGWSQAEISRHAEAVQAIGKELHKRMALFVERMEKMGKLLDQLTGEYNKTVTALNGRQGFMSSAKKLEALGCRSEKTLPDGLQSQEKTSPHRPEDEEEGWLPESVLNEPESSLQVLEDLEARPV